MTKTRIKGRALKVTLGILGVLAIALYAFCFRTLPASSLPNYFDRTQANFHGLMQASHTYKILTGQYPNAKTAVDLIATLTRPMSKNNDPLFVAACEKFSKGQDSWGNELLLTKKKNGDSILTSVGPDGVLGGKDDYALTLWNEKVMIYLSPLSFNSFEPVELLIWYSPEAHTSGVPFITVTNLTTNKTVTVGATSRKHSRDQFDLLVRSPIFAGFNDNKIIEYAFPNAGKYKIDLEGVDGVSISTEIEVYSTRTQSPSLKIILDTPALKSIFGWPYAEKPKEVSIEELLNSTKDDKSVFRGYLLYAAGMHEWEKAMRAHKNKKKLAATATYFESALNFNISTSYKHRAKFHLALAKGYAGDFDATLKMCKLLLEQPLLETELAQKAKKVIAEIELHYRKD